MKHRKVFIVVALLLALSLVAIAPAQASGDCGGCPECPPPPPPCGEGCTPGYWKQEHHYDSWMIHAPSDSFSGVFGVDLGYATLGLALRAKGGGDGKLARHGTAALLSAAQSGVDYPFTVAEVIALVVEGNAEALVRANEQACPLN
jgi:hypothetical protein